LKEPLNYDHNRISEIANRNVLAQNSSTPHRRSKPSRQSIEGWMARRPRASTRCHTSFLCDAWVLFDFA